MMMTWSFAIAVCRPRWMRFPCQISNAGSVRVPKGLAYYDLIHCGTRKLPLRTRAPHAAAWCQGTAAPDVVFEDRLLRAMPRSEYLSHFVSCSYKRQIYAQLSPLGL